MLQRAKTILVGTVGQGVMRTHDGGRSWRRLGVNQGLHSDAIVRALANDPREPAIVLAGTDRGLYRSEDSGASWRPIASALREAWIWAMTFDASEADTVFVGTGTPTPAGIFRSPDGGSTWEACPVDIAKECENVGTPRITGIAVDPVAHENVWVGIEADGVRHSSDGGRTWRAISSDVLSNPDVHNVAVTAPPHRSVFVVTSDDVVVSEDNGGSWRSSAVTQLAPYTRYPRGIAAGPTGTGVVYLTTGDTTPGEIGTVLATWDVGRSWRELTLPVPPNSSMWVLNVQPFDPDVLIAGSRYGYLYGSEDGGKSWRRFRREFSEIAAIVWLPD